MFFLNNLISRQHYKLRLFNQFIENLEHCPGVIEVGSVKHLALVLLKGKQLHLRIVYQLSQSTDPIHFLSIKNLSLFFISWILQVGPEELQMTGLYYFVC
jgi:hypothetical protein